MHTVFVTGSDTGVGKTQVVAALARLLAAGGARVQIVKPVETGRKGDAIGDAVEARRLAGVAAEVFTLATYEAPLAPLAAAAAEHRPFVMDQLIDRLASLPDCDWRIVEGAGGVAVPLDSAGRDWTDFAVGAGISTVIVVVRDRLGAINQARLAHGHATRRGLRAAVWLNAKNPSDPAVAAANRAGLELASVPVCATQAHGAVEPDQPELVLRFLAADDPDFSASPVAARCRTALDERDRSGLRRRLRTHRPGGGVLNLADNDYLDLARDPAVAEAAAMAARDFGTSASASPLITGWQEPHERLVDRLCDWHGFPCGLLWSSGYAANSAVLGTLPARGDLVLADRLIHHSMIAGLLRGGARLQRYRHLDLDQLETFLDGAGKRTVFVVTESVFSMDGDFPDLRRMAELKRRHGFFWIVDEAHALGWYGPEGAGLVREAGVEAEVDVLVGTLGKTLAAGGAYTLFRDESVRDHLANAAGEFVFSTALSPVMAATAGAALERVRELSVGQPDWHATSRRFRERLRAEGWDAPEGDGPVVPVRVGEAGRAVALAAALREAGIIAAAVRPPTVPEGTSRLRFSLKRTFDDEAIERVLAALAREGCPV